MSQPQWITPAGALGTVAEGLFFTTPVLAVDPQGGIVKYKLIAGKLPEGIQVKTNGMIEGIPQAYAKVQGVPKPVAENVTSRFAIRAYTETLGVTTHIADRTFSITVTGQNLPEFVTPAGSLGVFYDGDTVSYQILFSDPDPGDRVSIALIGGQLPPGLTLTAGGLITGWIEPVAPLPDTAIAGYDRIGTAYDQYPFDFSSKSISKNYEFTLQIFDGKDRTQRTFTMFVVSRNNLTADDINFTADNNYITADVMPQRSPFITNYPVDGYIGLYRHSNFFAYQFQALDLDGDPIEYGIVMGDSMDLPPGLSLNTDTGWLYGYLPSQGATEQTFKFDVFVFKKNDPSLMSPPYSYQIDTIGDVETAVDWLTPADLGTIDNGGISTFTIEAVNAEGKLLFYRLKPGSYPSLPGYYNKLPQGLQLLPSGHIAGRVSFNTFALDGGKTTFDVDIKTRLVVKPTTFDSSFTFTVEAYSQDGLISIFKTFTITVVRKYNEPYDGLYIQAMPGEEGRALLDSLLQNQDILKPALLYRPDDPYFRVPRNVIYTHAYGLNSERLIDYVNALELNHFKKQLVLGELKVAQARKDNIGDVIYEVVYSEIQDSGVNEKGESPGQTVPVPYPFVDPNDGSTEITEVYPNSLVEMRNQVIDVIGQYAEILPLWMTSKQSNGRVLGFTKAFVIAYCKPNKGEQVSYNIKTMWGERLNLIDFIADRYTLDRQYSKNWDPTGTYVSGNNGNPANDITVGPGIWNPSPAEATTFDILPYYALSVNAIGSGYKVNDTIKILGSNIGGVNGDNDLHIIVTSVNTSGRILTANYYGTVNVDTPINSQFNNVSAVNVSSFGVGATFNILVVDVDGATTFDGGGTTFITPEDNYGLTDKYNAYLLYPKVNILNGPPTPPPPPPVFT